MCASCVQGGAAEMRQQLVELIEATGGYLEPAANGEVVYVLPENPRLAIRQRSARGFMEATRDFVVRNGMRFVRFAFGKESPEKSQLSQLNESRKLVFYPPQT